MTVTDLDKVCHMLLAEHGRCALLWGCRPPCPPATYHSSPLALTAACWCLQLQGRSPHSQMQARPAKHHLFYTLAQALPRNALAHAAPHWTHARCAVQCQLSALWQLAALVYSHHARQVTAPGTGIGAIGARAPLAAGNTARITHMHCIAATATDNVVALHLASAHGELQRLSPLLARSVKDGAIIKGAARNWGQSNMSLQDSKQYCMYYHKPYIPACKISMKLDARTAQCRLLLLQTSTHVPMIQNVERGGPCVVHFHFVTLTSNFRRRR